MRFSLFSYWRYDQIKQYYRESSVLSCAHCAAQSHDTPSAGEVCQRQEAANLYKQPRLDRRTNVCFSWKRWSNNWELTLILHAELATGMFAATLRANITFQLKITELTYRILNSTPAPAQSLSLAHNVVTFAVCVVPPTGQPGGARLHFTRRKCLETFVKYWQCAEYFNTFLNFG